MGRTRTALGDLDAISHAIATPPPGHRSCLIGHAHVREAALELRPVVLYAIHASDLRQGVGHALWVRVAAAHIGMEQYGACTGGSDRHQSARVLP